MSPGAVLSYAAAALLSLPGIAAAEDHALSFRLEVSRTHHADHDTILVVATARNVGSSVLRAWGLFDYSGGYRPSAETFEHWRAIRDSALAASEVARAD